MDNTNPPKCIDYSSIKETTFFWQGKSFNETRDHKVGLIIRNKAVKFDQPMEQKDTQDPHSNRNEPIQHH
uniref:Uncharacterized protein n=1 Tax=Arion vulgaris TaxID=1028688 RepID=A0A0B6Z9P8_9EUPU